jgi:tetratricopeptide (TPR) repeat protein
MSAVLRRLEKSAKKICRPGFFNAAGRCSGLLIIAVFFFAGCAVQQQPSAMDKISFRVLPGKYRQKALDYEAKGLLLEAIQSWSIVLIFQSDNLEIQEKIKALRKKSSARAEEHYQQGVSYFENGRLMEARKEFLRTLAYDQDHAQALTYVKKRLQQPVFKTYTVQSGDTLKKIADQELQDPGKDFLITVFNTVDPSRSLPPGTQLRIPLLGKDFLQKKSVAGAAPPNNAMMADEKKQVAADDSIPYQKAKELLAREEYHESLQLLRSVDSNFRDVRQLISTTEVFLQQEADGHYRKGISYFLSEELDKAIAEWEEALRLWPAHLKARKDLGNARKMQQRMNQ